MSAKIPTALQLYTVRDELERDTRNALRQVAAMGYEYVELFTLGGMTAKEYRTVLEDTGLKATGLQVRLDTLLGDGQGQAIKDARDLGVSDIIIPWIPVERRQGKQSYLDTAKDLNKIGRSLKENGVQLSYHNHDFEFTEKIDGKPAMEVLLDETDPDLVKGEIDTYWVLFGGADPVAFLSKYPGRFPFLHIKDMDANDRTFVPVGTGILPLDAIVKAAPLAGAKYMILEQDDCPGPSLRYARMCLDNYRARGYA